MGQGDPGSQHQGGVTPSLGPHSITFRSANASRRPLRVTSFRPYRHVRFAPRADIRPMPAFLSTRHRAHISARLVSDAGTTPTTRT